MSANIPKIIHQIWIGNKQEPKQYTNTWRNYIIQNKELVELSNLLPCTFHRAFDEINNQMEALHKIIECGFKTILTSGNANNALEGLSSLKALASKANDKICIMPGGGVRANHIEILKENIATNWFHSSAVLQKETANMDEVFMLKSKLN